MFSLEQLLFAIANDQRSNTETIKKIIPMLLKVFEIEKADRQALKVFAKIFYLTIFIRNINQKSNIFRMPELLHLKRFMHRETKLTLRS